MTLAYCIHERLTGGIHHVARGIEIIAFSVPAVKLFGLESFCKNSFN